MDMPTHVEWNDLPHEEKYRALYEAFGLKIPDNFMDMDIAEWKRLYEEDEHLNNVPLSIWDQYASHFVRRNNPLRERWPISPAEGVCPYKQAVKDRIFAEYPDTFFQGFMPKEPDRYVMRKSGIFVIRRGRATFQNLMFVKPFEGKIVIWDNEAPSGAKVFEINKVLTAFSTISLPYRLYNGLTVEVETEKECYLILKSQV